MLRCHSMKRLNRVSFCCSLSGEIFRERRRLAGAGSCRRRLCRRGLRRGGGRLMEKRRRGAGAGEAGQAGGEIDLAPFRVPPLRLKLGEAREDRIDEAADALGRAGIAFGFGREQHHAGGDGADPAAGLDQIWIVLSKKLGGQIGCLEPRPERHGQEMDAGARPGWRRPGATACRRRSRPRRSRPA